MARPPLQKATSRPAHHGPDGRFRNPSGSPARNAGLGDMLPFLWRMTRKRGHLTVPPAGHVLSPAEVRAGMARLGNHDRLTWLGHVAFLMRINGVTLLTDPYLSANAGPGRFGPRRYVPPALGVTDLPPLDLLLVSHNHYDHLDAATVAALPGKDRLRVVVPLGLGGFFRQRGYAHIDELDWYDSIDHAGVTVTATPAVHFSRRGLRDTNRTLWAGFVVTSKADGRQLYFSGDTAHGAVFREMGQRLGPIDLALVGIGAYEPRIIMQASHATPEEAVAIARDIGAKRLIGMHWGTVVLADEPQFEAPERLARAAAAAGYAPHEAGIMKIGETLAF
ncbi:MBL fold metallo-hydrolase [Ferrovibrio xuzhouensis]|uniref:MBL fold metallo-hydrolase n=1 Tax=Ferrovibrio xuzhouensis TaxID=1576914 RepID=A0ABV7VGX1_9PROT